MRGRREKKTDRLYERDRGGKRLQRDWWWFTWLLHISLCHLHSMSWPSPSHEMLMHMSPDRHFHPDHPLSAFLSLSFPSHCYRSLSSLLQLLPTHLSVPRSNLTPSLCHSLSFLSLSLSLFLSSPLIPVLRAGSVQLWLRSAQVIRYSIIGPHTQASTQTDCSHQQTETE